MNYKIRILLYVLAFFICGTTFGQENTRTFKVVIDAGHGAHDPGCIGSQVNEKTMNLNMALKVGKLIEEHCPEVKVIYTRKTDVFVELYRRAQIANNAHADLFISIHCNSSENPAGNGVETFVMGLSKSEANQAVARKENSAILMEKNYQNNYDGFNPNSPESYVVFSLYSTAYLNKSIILADKVQKNLVATSHLNNRGVKQANYWVLYKVAMPSILIELGFLSNPKDQAYLIQKSNQDRLAATIYNAFVDYLDVVNNTKHAHLPVSSSTPDKPAEEPVPPVAIDTTITTPEPATQTQPVVANNNTNSSNSNSNTGTTTAKEDEVRFKIQILASPVKLELSDKRIWNIPDLGYYQENGLWKYTAGNETTYEEANKLLNTIKQTHPDAFMIAFQGDKKISVSEARKLTKK
ncbi:MAG: N-acetylmuramoyl-L-alanine amidase [Bacteroidales bacterium]|nr:N-acetylmuramoyl-L-alanine amidase [Bacteroidales bacterium]